MLHPKNGGRNMPDNDDADAVTKAATTTATEAATKGEAETTESPD